ncbi:MAG: hypothetical protein EOP11_22980 [Proteobacteria bacterium]|nr:MAG: hypothetical protein EOP11_22980 [Pseudomonadota bacterium]
MKTPKLPLIAALTLATVFMVACGEEKDARISDADALCLKILKNGGTCGGTTGSAANATATTTLSTTVTNSTTNTVTITQTGTTN